MATGTTDLDLMVLPPSLQRHRHKRREEQLAFFAPLSGKPGGKEVGSDGRQRPEPAGLVWTIRHGLARLSRHRHHQFDRTAVGERLVNAGSVGMPFEVTVGVAYWALLGPAVELRHTPYDFAQARSAIRMAGFPAADELIEYRETAPAAEEVAAYFESVSLGDSSS